MTINRHDTAVSENGAQEEQKDRKQLADAA